MNTDKEKEPLWWMMQCPKSEPCYCKEECMYLRQKSREKEELDNE